ncbi:MAG: sigma-70 family RNA polymerase sigma factor [Verrucomicrobia bacterium]|nr:sigma-70 family RNA polymerase sigma factor [Verrucomicrobiota bacterium]
MEKIVSQHETALLRYAARLVNSPTAAQDVVQNVFIKLFKNWDGHSQPSDKLKSWLFRVTHNEAVDLIRRESRLKVLHEKHAEERREDTCPDGHNCPPSHEERKATVLTHLKRLHPREQQIVLLRLEQGLSYRDISEITGRSEGNVGNILHHAIRKLSTVLQQEGVIQS